MSTTGEMQEKAKEIRQRLRNPPNAVYDPGINLTRESTAYKGDIPPPGTPPKKKLESTPLHEPVNFPLTFDDVVGAVSRHYGIPIESIKGPKRYKPLVLARQVVVYLSLKLLAKRSLCSIRRELNKDHTSVIHARRQIQNNILNDISLALEINKIEQAIADRH